MNRPLAFALLALLLGGCASTIPLSTPDMKAYEVSLAAEGQQLALSWYGTEGRQHDALYLRYLDSRGRGTGAPVRLTDDSHHAYEPSLQLLDGDAVVAWYEREEQGGLQAFIARFAPDGQPRWMKTLSPDGATGRIPVVRVAGGTVHVAWLQMETDAPDGARLYAARLNSDGAWQQVPHAVAAASRDTWNLNAAIATDGSFLVVFDARWQRKAKELQLLRIRGARASLTLLSADDDVESGYPDLALQGDRAAITWFDQRDGNQEIYLFAGPLSALASPIDAQAVRVTHTAGNSFGAYVAWNGAQIGLAWCDEIDGTPRVYLQTFDQSGHPVRDAMPLTDGLLQGLIPSIVPWRQGFAVAWNERRADPDDLPHGGTLESVAKLRIVDTGASR